MAATRCGGSSGREPFRDRRRCRRKRVRGPGLAARPVSVTFAAVPSGFKLLLARDPPTGLVSITQQLKSETASHWSSAQLPRQDVEGQGTPMARAHWFGCLDGMRRRRSQRWRKAVRSMWRTDDNISAAHERNNGSNGLMDGTNTWLLTPGARLRGHDSLVAATGRAATAVVLISCLIPEPELASRSAACSTDFARHPWKRAVNSRRWRAPNPAGVSSFQAARISFSQIYHSAEPKIF